MAAFDFPASPGVGAIFIDPVSGASYTWNGYAWLGGTGNSLGALVVGDNPPAVPADNSLWFESDTGMLFLRYNDGNSSQWVQLNALPNGAGYMPLRGVSDGSDASAGQIGEVISSVVTAPGASLTNSTVATVTSISLTPGDWDVTGDCWIVTGTGTVSAVVAGISVGSTVLAPVGIAGSRTTLNSTFLTGALQTIPIRPFRTSLTVTTACNLLALSNFTSGASNSYGALWARRAR